MPEQHRIVTFYSYKGGTGRSMALANFAWILAAAGQKVLAIDWDLEAPGLHRYFRPFLVDPDLADTEGLIDAFWDFASSTIASVQSDGKSLNSIKDSAEDQLGQDRSIPIIPASSEQLDGNAEALEDTKRRLDWQFPSGGYIDFICAGRQNATYSQRVNTFDWKRFYEIGGASLIAQVKVRLIERYNWVLIDSRTGVSDTSGICTIEMPDTVVACFTLNRQSIEGVRAILTSIRDYRSTTVDGSKIAFFPVATRIENAEQLRLETARSYAREALAKFLPARYQSRARDYWDNMEFAYRPAYAFEEVLAAFGDATGASGASDTMLSQVEATARCITDNDSLSMPEIVSKDRERVLAKYALGAARSSRAPELGNNISVARDDADSEILRNVRAKEQVWRASGFLWHHMLSRREIDLLTPEDRKGFGRSMTYYLTQSETMQKLLRTANRACLLIWSQALVIGVCASVILGQRSTDFIYSRPPLDVFFKYPTVWMSRSFLSVPLAGFAGAIVGTLLLLRDKPYGLRLLTIFQLLVSGPLVPDIRDYDPNKQTAYKSGRSEVAP